jgi:hypothetical protein
MGPCAAGRAANRMSRYAVQEQLADQREVTRTGVVYSLTTDMSPRAGLRAFGLHFPERPGRAIALLLGVQGAAPTLRTPKHPGHRSYPFGREDLIFSAWTF